jgi:hypothetical protein
MMPDPSPESAHLPSHSAPLPATPHAEGRGARRPRRFRGWWFMGVWVTEADPNPFPVIRLFRRLP